MRAFILTILSIAFCGATTIAAATQAEQQPNLYVIIVKDKENKELGYFFERMTSDQWRQFRREKINDALAEHIVTSIETGTEEKNLPAFLLEKYGQKIRYAHAEIKPNVCFILYQFTNKPDDFNLDAHYSSLVEAQEAARKKNKTLNTYKAYEFGCN